MQRIFWRSLITTGVFVGVCVFGAASNVTTVFHYNVYTSIIEKYAPASYVYFSLAVVILYLGLTLWGLAHGRTSTRLAASDIAKLDVMSNFFRKQFMHEFFEYLYQNRCVYMDTLDQFDLAVGRLLNNDMNISNKTIDRARKRFLRAIGKFSQFASKTFSVLPNEKVVKFYGGVSEFNILTSDDFDQDMKQYNQVLKKLRSSWDALHDVVSREEPDYVWK